MLSQSEPKLTNAGRRRGEVILDRLWGLHTERREDVVWQGCAPSGTEGASGQTQCNCE